MILCFKNIAAISDYLIAGKLIWSNKIPWKEYFYHSKVQTSFAVKACPVLKDVGFFIFKLKEEIFVHPNAVFYYE